MSSFTPAERYASESVLFNEEHQPLTLEEQHIYDPLKLDNSFRLAELLPGEELDTIQCQLYESSLDDATKYQALSYTWGEPNEKTNIVCNGKSLRVPINLRDFLRRIRDPKESRILWADSICINQEDLDERGNQVTRMGTIYSNAEEVLIWLGNLDPFSSFSLDEDVCDLGKRYLLEYRDRSKLDAQSTYRPGFNNFWKSVSKLYDCPWFSRIWVIQEASLARRSTAVMGQRAINFKKWMSFDFSLLNCDILVRYNFSIQCTKFWMTEDPDLATSWLHDRDCIEILEANSTQLASDPRDYVFGLLGFPSATVHGELLIKPNYHQSYLDVMHTTAMQILRRTADLRILCVGKLPRGDDWGNPSWVPLWKWNHP